VRRTFLEHWEELSKKLRVCFLLWFVVFLIFLYFSNKIISISLIFLPKNWQIIVVEPLEVLIVQLYLSAVLSFIAILPIFLYSIYSFAKPGLLKGELKIVRRILLLFLIFFFLGIMFSIFLFIPLTFKIMEWLTGGIKAKPLISLRKYFEFTVFSTLLIGLLFNFPLFLLSLSRLGLISSKDLERKRSIVFLVLLIIASIITPDPTPLTTLILMAPIWVLYEVSILLMKRKFIFS